MLVEENYLYAVISLPVGIFNPYSGVKTSVLLFDKALARRTDKILFVTMNNDGFDLGAQRRPIEKNDIPEIIKIVKKFAFCVSTESEKDFIDDSGLSIVATKDEIAKNDYVLVGNRYKILNKINSRYEIVKLGDICCTASGGTPLSNKEEYYLNGNILWLTSGEVANGYIYNTKHRITESGLLNSSAKIFPVDTVVVAMYGATAGQVGIIKSEMATNQAVCGIFPDKKIVPEYLYYVLKSLKDKMIASSVGGAQPNISQKIIRNLEIPLPPIETQKLIVAGLESYQKIIDGARQIVENYRPTICFDKQWKVAKLGSIAKLTYGYTATAQEAGSARLIRITDISPAGLINNFNQKYVDLNDQNTEYVLKRGDIIVARTGATFGKTAIFDYEYPAVYASFLIKIDFIQRDVLNKFYWIFAQSPEYWDQANKLVGGGGQPQFNANAISRIEVPIPPIEEQEKIISKVEDEMLIVEQNKRLIQIFEQKIKDKINEVWGSETK